MRASKPAGRAWPNTVASCWTAKDPASENGGSKIFLRIVAASLRWQDTALSFARRIVAVRKTPDLPLVRQYVGGKFAADLPSKLSFARQKMA